MVLANAAFLEITNRLVPEALIEALRRFDEELPIEDRPRLALVRDEAHSIGV